MRTAVVLLACAVLAPTPAVGTVIGEGNGSVDGDGTVSTEVWVTEDGEVIEPAGTGAGSGSSPRAFRYVYEPFGAWSTEAGGPFCDAGDGWPGWKYRVTMVGAAGAIVGAPLYECVPFPDPGDQSEPPDPPVLLQPPTVAEIWHAVASASLPRPEIGVSPITDGVTALETWMWVATETADSVPVTATIGPWSVTGTATRTGYRFDFGDGPDSYSVSATGGSEADPPARHTYETKGPYVLSASSTWTATFSLTGPNVAAPLPIDVGAVAVTTTRDYRVVEIRSVLVG